jgi:hypothetical protein
MSFPQDDVTRCQELAGEGLSACAIERYMNNISLGMINVAIGRRDGNIRTNENLSTRQRQRYINSMVICRE